jgi:hypothetical protein
MGECYSAYPRVGVKLYRPGDTVVFKYEGNVRPEVTGHRVVGGKVWVEARAADLTAARARAAPLAVRSEAAGAGLTPPPTQVLTGLG